VDKLKKVHISQENRDPKLHRINIYQIEYQQCIEPTVYWTDSLSNWQFIELAIYQNGIYQTDNLPK